ncbi:MAG: hypothetical protein R2939_01765 [Kofleriaceae bacterium]
MRAPASCLTLALALVLPVGAGAARADADALTDTLGPRETAVGGALRAGATGASGVALNPAGLPLNQEMVFEGGYGYRARDAASAVSLTACDSTVAMPGCFFYSYVDTAPELGGAMRSRTTHTAGMSLSRMISPQVAFGTTVKYFDHNTDVMGESDASGFTFDAGVTARATDLMSLGLVGYNLWGERSPNFPRAIGAGALARPTPAFALTFDALWNLDADDGSGRYGGGAEYFVLTRRGQVGYPLRAGAVHDVAGGGHTYVTGGLGLATMKLAFDVAAQREVAGGDELLITASLRFFGPRVEAGAMR